MTSPYPLRGIPKTQEHKNKMRAAKLGKKKTIEHRQAMRHAHNCRYQFITQLCQTMGITRKEALVFAKDFKEFILDCIEKQGQTRKTAIMLYNKIMREDL
jgi:hypothetical protein